MLSIFYGSYLSLKVFSLELIEVQSPFHKAKPRLNLLGSCSSLLFFMNIFTVLVIILYDVRMLYRNFLDGRLFSFLTTFVVVNLYLRCTLDSTSLL
jgi:hypothetical protein